MKMNFKQGVIINVNGNRNKSVKINGRFGIEYFAINYFGIIAVRHLKIFERLGMNSISNISNQLNICNGILISRVSLSGFDMLKRMHWIFLYYTFVFETYRHMVYK